MACSNPNLVEFIVDSDGTVHSRFVGPAKTENPLEFGTFDNLVTDGKMRKLVPCGKCLGCQLDYSHEWADRMVLELVDNDYKAIFVTLTYDNAHVKYIPSGDMTLSVDDVQLFFKRLRKAFSGRRIRYYLAGEYGPKTFRPHYHAIIYGLSLSDFDDLRQVGCNELKQPYFSSLRFANIWKNGFVSLCDVTYRTCAYVARYCTKKQYTRDYDLLDWRQHPEFNVSSRLPGIGMLKIDERIKRLRETGETVINVDGKDGIHQVYFPRSFLKNMKNRGVNISDIQYERSVDSYERLISNLAYSGCSFPDFLDKRRDALAKRTKVLPSRSDF